MVIDLDAIQRAHREWVDRNFPDETLSQAIHGVAEEAGELSHHFLKEEQGIRVDEDHVAGMVDAVGDLMIYLMSVCDHLRISLSDVLVSTWTSVEKRDWANYPEKGVPVD